MLLPLMAVNVPIVVGAFALYTVAIVALGLYASKFAARSDEDYFLAGRSLNRWVAALSASASSESGWVTLGLVGIGFGAGVQGYWVIPGCLLGYIFNWFILAGPLHDQARKLNALTLPDFLCKRFGRSSDTLPLVRIVAVVVILAAMMAYVAAQMAAAGKAFDILLTEAGVEDAAPVAASTDTGSAPGATAVTQPHAEGAKPQSDGDSLFAYSNYKLGVLIGAVVVLLYTVTGGFRAVSWTDFLQALLMVGTLVVFPVYLLITYGGFGYLQTHLADYAYNGADPGHLLDFTGGHVGWALVGFVLGSHALGINFGYPGQPHVLVRFMALKRRAEARIAGFVAVLWGLLVYFGAVTVGLFAHAIIVDTGAGWGAAIRADGEVSLIVSAMELLPSVLAGLVLAAILAAICSTADSQLIVAASAVAHDIFAKLFSTDSKTAHMLANRGTVLALGLGAVLLVINRDVQIYQYVLTYGWAMLGAAFGPQMILAVLWKRASYAGCLAGMLTGFVVAIAWAELYDKSATGIEIYNLPVAFLAALIVNIFFSLDMPDRNTREEPRP